jgi:hypothetical protein
MSSFFHLGRILNGLSDLLSPGNFFDRTHVHFTLPLLFSIKADFQFCFLQSYMPIFQFCFSQIFEPFLSRSNKNNKYVSKTKTLTLSQEAKIPITKLVMYFYLIRNKTSHSETRLSRWSNLSNSELRSYDICCPIQPK